MSWHTKSNGGSPSVSVSPTLIGSSRHRRQQMTRRKGAVRVAHHVSHGVFAAHLARLPSRRTWVEEASRRRRLWFRWCAARGGRNSPRCGAASGGRPSPHWRSRGRRRQGSERRGAGPLPAARRGEDRARRALRPQDNSGRRGALPRAQPAPVGIVSTGRGHLCDPRPGVRAEACASDFYHALDAAVAKLDSRMRRAADRRRVHRGSRTPTSVAAATGGRSTRRRYRGDPGAAGRRNNGSPRSSAAWSSGRRSTRRSR